MGLDLYLLPFDEGSVFSHTLLSCERRRDLFEVIMGRLSETPVPDTFYTYLSREDDQDSHYGITTETPYGEPLGWVLASRLLEFAAHEGVRDNFTNRAIWAYLAELPSKTRVALYWH